MFEIDNDTKQFPDGTIDSLTSHIAILDRWGIIIEVNRAWREFAKHNDFQGNGFGIGANYIEVCIPPDQNPQDGDPQAIKAASGILDVINGKRNFFELEYPCHGSDQQRWFIMRVTGLGEGDDLKIVVAHENITERRKVENALRESEESYRILTETVSDAIIRIDENSVIHFINRAGEDVFGYKAEEMIGQPLDLIMPEEFRAAHHAGIKSYLETGKPTIKWKDVEFPARHRDGHIFPMEVSFSDYKTDNKHFFIGIVRDITERKQTEKATAHLAAIVESSDDAIISKNLRGIITTWNKGAEKIFGYKSGEVIGKSIDILFPFYRIDEEPLILERISRGEKIDHYETIRLRKDRTEVDISLTISPILDKSGKIIGASKIARDISGRKRTEESLRENQAMLSLAMKSSRMGVWERNVKTGEVYWSEELEKIFGLEKGAFAKTRTSFYDLMHADDRKRTLEEIDRAVVEHRDYTVEFRFIHADNSIHWMEGRGQAIYNDLDEPVKLYGIGIDITERKRADQVLQESENRFRMMSDNAPMLVWMSGTDKLRTYFNQTWLDFTGRAMAEEIGDGWIRGIYPKDYEQCLKTYKNSFDARKEFEMEYRLRHFNGDYCWVIDRGVPLFTPEGVFKGYIGSCVDVTERKESELRREDILRREHAARLEAEAASRAKDEFLSVLSHELRTPLNSMFGWIRMLRAGMLNEERTVQAFEVIERNVRLQNNLIEDLLDVSRIITGKMRIETERVDFVSIINSSVEAARPAADAKNISLTVETESDSQIVSGDATRLQQIVGNLINNAIKFTPQNGIVSLELKRADGKIRLEVRDSGIGISKEFLPMIFDRFKQADSTTKRAHSGLGLGLTIVKNLTELHYGTIKALSDGDNSGATFVVEFPPYIQAEVDFNAKIEKFIGQTDEALNGVEVLLVDDDCDSLLPLQMLLESQKANVECADSAQAALDKLSEKNFDILISDIGMPDMDGYELLSKVRQSANGDGTQIPAIALTAYASTQDRQRALAAGFQYHLAKPIDFDRFLSAIKSLLNDAEQK